MQLFNMQTMQIFKYVLSIRSSRSIFGSIVFIIFLSYLHYFCDLDS